MHTWQHQVTLVSKFRLSLQRVTHIWVYGVCELRPTLNQTPNKHMDESLVRLLLTMKCSMPRRRNPKTMTDSGAQPDGRRHNCFELHVRNRPLGWSVRWV